MTSVGSSKRWTGTQDEEQRMTTYFVKQLVSPIGEVYAYESGSAIASITQESKYRAQTAAPAGRGGRFTAGPLFDALTLTLKGTLEAPNPSDTGSMRSEWDAFCAAHSPGPAGQFYLDSDRYANVEVVSSIQSEWDGLPSRAYQVALASYDDPPWFAATPTVVALASGANALAPSGTGPMEPQITVVVSACPTPGTTPGTSSSITLTDQAGTVFTLFPSGTGTWLIDSLNEQISLGGTVQAYTGYTGAYPVLPAGTGALTVALVGGLTVSSISLSYQARWY
jgi:hypothetical protein